MQSHTIRLYKKVKMSPEQLSFVDSVYKWAEDNYNIGNPIVESFTPEEICDEFETLDEVINFCLRRADHECDIKNA